jgi:histidyl-tRNA synthetase
MDKKIEPKLLKGFRDFSPEQMIQRNFVIQKIREVVQSYGFDQIENPTLEYEEILTGNIGEDEKMIYRFVDDGDRHVALRYDQTVGACRYIAMNYGQLTFPFKRYQIQNVFRAENTQKGRYREFLQFDADIFGVDDVGADIEMILVTCDIYTALGFTDFFVHVSDRALITDVPYTVLVTIDKLDKLGKEGVIEELRKKGYEDGEALVEKVLHAEPNERITSILKAVKENHYENRVVFDPSIMRAFSYSTGTIWEVKAGDNPSSLMGGERFDSLVARFSKENISGVGFGVGFDRTFEAMQERGLLPKERTTSELLITTFDEQYMEDYFTFARLLRDEGIHSEIYPVYTDKLAKQIKYADKKGIPFILVMGEDEKKKEVVAIKDMNSGEQTLMSFDQIVTFIKGPYEED